MSSEHKKIALERINEAFKNPTWYNIDDIKYLSMLNLTQQEIDEIMDVVRERLHKYSMMNIELHKALYKAKLL